MAITGRIVVGVCDIDRMGIDDNKGIDDCDNVAGVGADKVAVIVVVFVVGEEVEQVLVVAIEEVVNVVVGGGVAVLRIGGARRRAVRHETHDVRSTRRWADDKRGLDCLNNEVD